MNDFVGINTPVSPLASRPCFDGILCNRPDIFAVVAQFSVVNNYYDLDGLEISPSACVFSD